MKWRAMVRGIPRVTLERKNSFNTDPQQQTVSGKNQ
jgi:hypothetical protein